jgi:hypothetical protein
MIYQLPKKSIYEILSLIKHIVKINLLSIYP